MSYYSRFSGGNGIDVQDTFRKATTTSLGIYCTVMLVVALIILYLVYQIYEQNVSESFTIRGQSYKDGQMIFGDVPEKVTAGGEEYDNPLYLEITRRWEPTDTKVNGYTVWKQKD